MEKRHPWTRQEIEALQEGFRQRKSLKILAEEFGRSLTSINKALSRFGIRQCGPKLFLRKKTSLKNVHQQKKYYKNKKNKLCLQYQDPFIWIDMKELTQWMKEQCIPVTETNNIYFMQKRPYTPLQILYIVNRMRFESQQKIFMVKGVTW
jgi:hypothetical protein